MENYLEPVLIDDPRLTPDLKRTRAGSRQEFSAPGKRSFDPDFTIEPPLRHVHAELINGAWYWVNGCDLCKNKPEKYAYIRCEEHDRCDTCRTKRKEFTEIPWGVEGGIRCKPCMARIKAEAKEEALAAMPEEFDEWDYYREDKIKCPYCNLEVNDDEGCYSDPTKNYEIDCDRCDNSFELTMEWEAKYTMSRKD